MAEEQQQQLGDEFAAVINQARDIDGAAAEVLEGPKPAGQVPAVVDPLASWEAIPRMLRPLVVGTLPEVAPAWSDEVIRGWAESAARAFPDSQGLPPMVGFAMSSAGLVLPVVLAVKVRRAKADAIKKAQDSQGTGDGQPAP